MDIKKMLRNGLIGAGAFLATVMPARATAVIANDTLDGLPAIGTQIGTFMTNLLPGLGAFMLFMVIVGGVAGIIGGVVYLIKRKIDL